MKIRTYTEKDLARIKKFYSEAKHDFEMPDPEHTGFVIRECLEEDGVVRLAAFGRAQLNAFLLVDGKWKSPNERLEAIQILEYAMIEKAKILGFDQTTAQVNPRFGQRLKEFGWAKSLGETWHKEF